MNAVPGSTSDEELSVVLQEVPSTKPARVSSKDGRRKFTGEQEAWIVSTWLNLRAREPDETNAARYSKLKSMFTGAFSSAKAAPAEVTVRRLLKRLER